MPLLLSRRDVESVLTMKDAVAAVEEGFRLLALGKVTMPQRTGIRLSDPNGIHLTMPAFVGTGGESREKGTGALAVKVVTVFPQNPALHGLPTTLATLLLNDPRSGALLAIMDAAFLTAMRTGGASGVATRHLARADARTVGIFGAGVQARAQLLAVCEVRKIERAIVCDLAPEARERFAAEMSARLSIPVTPTDDPRTCAENDIVVTATSSHEPIFDGTWIRPGTHINGVGSHSPDARELDAECVRRARVVADHTPACLAEAGDLLLPIRDGVIGEDHIAASLGEVVAGAKPGRRTPEEITLFKSVGLAVQDAVTARRVYQLALSSGAGLEFQI